MRKWYRLQSTRRYVERAEARLHRLAASCTLGIRDLNEDRLTDSDQRAITHHLKVAEVQLNIVLDVMGMVRKRAHAKIARVDVQSP